MITIVDTGPLVALLNRTDQYHDWVQEVLAGLELPFWTCEPVLTEAAYLTGRPAELMRMVADGKLLIGFEIAEQSDSLARLLTRYAGRMDLADACVVRLSELHRQSRVLTTDRNDFSFYRRNGRELIPLLAPP